MPATTNDNVTLRTRQVNMSGTAGCSVWRHAVVHGEVRDRDGTRHTLETDVHIGPSFHGTFRLARLARLGIGRVRSRNYRCLVVPRHRQRARPSKLDGKDHQRELQYQRQRTGRTRSSRTAHFGRTIEPAPGIPRASTNTIVDCATGVCRTSLPFSWTAPSADKSLPS